MNNDRLNDNSAEKLVSVGDVLFILKQNIVLMLAIFILVFSCGVVYSYAKDPDYSAKEQVVYTAKNNIESTTTNNINAMRAYVDTVMDFCDEGVVLDRANYYYAEYKNNISSYKSVDDYIENLKINDSYTGQGVKQKSFSASNIDIISSGEEETGFVFYVTYTDENQDSAKEKVKILVCAYDREVKAVSSFSGETEIKYFDDISISIKDLGTVSVAPSVSKLKIMIIFTALGVVLAIIVVYIKNLFDNTVKNKEELERISGVSVISSIEREGGNN